MTRPQAPKVRALPTRLPMAGPELVALGLLVLVVLLLIGRGSPL